MARYISVLVLLSLFIIPARVQGIAIRDSVKVWAVPAEQKVRPDDRVESSNLVWSGENKKITVAGAGNEHVPFQVVITTPVPEGWRPKAPDGFFITASDLTSVQGKTIPQKQISLYLEHYIMLFAKSSPIGATGYWPDALAPIGEPFSMAAQYAVVGNRPVWVDIFIPAGTPGGIYMGEIKVTQHGKIVETLSVQAEVYNFSLPDQTHLIMYINISKSELARFTINRLLLPKSNNLPGTISISCMHTAWKPGEMIPLCRILL